jgi:hypothetical protein
MKGKEIPSHVVRRKHLCNVSSNLDSVVEDFPDRIAELTVGQVGMN